MIDHYLQPVSFAGKSYFRFLITARLQYLLYILIRSLWFVPWIFEIGYLVQVKGIYLDHLLGQLIGAGMISIIIDLSLHDITVEKVTGLLRVKMDRVKVLKGTLKGFQVRVALSESIRKKDSTEEGKYLLIVDDGKEKTYVNYRLRSKKFPETLKSDIDQYCDIVLTSIPDTAPGIGYTYIPEMDSIVVYPTYLDPRDIYETFIGYYKEIDEQLKKGKR